MVTRDGTYGQTATGSLRKGGIVLVPTSSDLLSAKGNESRDRLGGAEEAGGSRASVIANRPVMPFDVTCSRPTFRCFFQLPLRCQVNSQQYSQVVLAWGREHSRQYSERVFLALLLRQQ